jgi:hypothetical protein
LAGLGAASPRIEHRRRGLVGEQLAGSLQRLQQPRVDRPEQEGRAAHPVSERRTIESDPLAGVDLRLAVERQMVCVLADDHVGDGSFGGDAALNQPRGRRRLDHHVLAGAAGVLGPAHHQHAELGRHDVQPLGAVLADQVKSS